MFDGSAVEGMDHFSDFGGDNVNGNFRSLSDGGRCKYVCPYRLVTRRYHSDMINPRCAVRVICERDLFRDADRIDIAGLHV